MEAFTQKSGYMLDYDYLSLLGNLAHFEASFTSIALMLILLLHYVTNTPIKNVLKVILPGFLVLVVAPTVDFIASSGKGYNFAYLSPKEHLGLFEAYLTYFGKYIGATIGIKVEVAIALFGIFLYCFIKTRDFFTSLIGCWMAYTLIFIWGATPFIVQPLIESLGFDYEYSGLTLLRYFLVVNFFLGGWIAYLVNKDTFLILMKEVPWMRILQYELLFVLGIFLGLTTSEISIKYELTLNPAIIGNGLLLSIAIFFSLISAMIINNLADTSIDKISNPGRALVRGLIDSKLYLNIAYSSMLLAVLYALPVGAQGVLITSCIMATYYLYSAPPLRLKRVLFISKLAISINSLSLLLLGFWLVRESVDAFPFVIYPIMLFGYTLAANFIDLKDVDGDRAAGIKTLPVVLGLRNAQWFCGAAFFITLLSCYFVFREMMFLPLLASVGLLQFFLLTRKRYHEAPVFIVHNAGLILLIAFLAR
jgi:4-hydroxybenzoate polyprenyltransferase